jgi:NAD(P)-dependent dehydrogenase (short-subunit alcohol dehydrogenase family)
VVDVKGRTVLVTGACGGLGSELTALLAAAGDTVFAADVNNEGLARLATIPGVVPLHVDVTRSEDLARARAAVEAVTEGLDGLVCCAGIFTGGPLVEAPEETIRHALEVNLMGVSRTVRELFVLLALEKGTIVAVSSEATRCAMPFNGPYTVSKCALEAYCDVLRRELMFTGVRVAIVQPGAIRTPFLESARVSLSRSAVGSRFAALLGKAILVLSSDRDTSQSPRAVASVIVRALRAPRPRARYRVGNSPLRALLGWLPAAWTDALIRRFA